MLSGKRTPYFALATIVLLCIGDAIHHHYEIEAIHARGVEVTARVTKVIMARGCNAYLRYTYKGVSYQNEINTTDYRFKVDDSIRIMILPERPQGTLEIQGRI